MNDRDEQRKKDIFAVLLWLGISLLKLIPIAAVIALMIWLLGTASV